jgi:hypothetical protein
MILTLIADHVVKGKIYPAFALHQGRPYTASWREFEQHWPYTIPLRLQEYCDHHTVPLNIVGLGDEWPSDAFYPVGLGFFDFGIDYFDLLPQRVFTELWHSHIRVLFYYHEGDNPERIKQRLDALVEQHQLPRQCYVFVSANTAADAIPGFVYFNDFELWYYQRNHNVAPLEIHNQPRSRDFTALVRLHKPWRAMAMADLHRNNLLNNSYWSYCETVTAPTDLNNSPIEIDSIKDLRTDTENFLAQTPYVSDELSNNERNNHSMIVPKYHVDSYCNIVFETHFDADQSSGAFLTEKTYKPIKHGQLFFIAGCAGSLQVLRDQGYRVFDRVLDNTYDRIENNTERWQRLCTAIKESQHRLADRFSTVQEDIEHNQRLFLETKTSRLNILLEHINESY